MVQVKYLSSAPTAWGLREVTEKKDIKNIYHCFDNLEEVNGDLALGIIGGGVYNIDFILDDQRVFHTFHHTCGAVNIYGFVDSDNSADQYAISDAQKLSVKYYKTEQDIGSLLFGLTEYEFKPLYPDKNP